MSWPGGQDVGRAPQQWGPSAGPPGGGLLRPSAAAERRLHRAGAGGGDRAGDPHGQGALGAQRGDPWRWLMFYDVFLLYSQLMFLKGQLYGLWPGYLSFSLFLSSLSLSKLRTTNLRKSWKGWATEKRCGSDGKSNVRKHWFSPLTYGNPHSDILAFRHVLIVLFLFKSHSRISGDNFNCFRIPAGVIGTIGTFYFEPPTASQVFVLTAGCDGKQWLTRRPIPHVSVCSSARKRVLPTRLAWQGLIDIKDHSIIKQQGSIECEPSGCTKSWVSIWIPKLWCLMVASEQVKTRLLPPRHECEDDSKSHEEHSTTSGTNSIDRASN